MAHILGLDIERNTLRGTLLRTQLRNNEVVRYLAAPIEVGPGQVGRAGALHDAMQQLIMEAGRVPDLIVTAMPGERASIRTVTLPAAVARRVSEVLPFELESVLPYAADEAVIDHQVLRNADGQLELLTAAVRHDHVRAHLTDLAAAGIEPRVVTVGALALEGLTALQPALREPGPHLLLEIGEDGTDFCILHHGRAELARTLSVGLKDLSQRPQQLRQAIHRTLVAYRASGGTEPTQVFLAGPRGDDTELCVWLSEQLSLHVLPLPLPVPVEGGLPPTPAFGRSTGLVGCAVARGKHINLRQGPFAVRRASGALRRQAGLLTGCAAAVLLAVLFSIASQRAVLRDEQAALRQQLSYLTEEIFGQRAATPTEARKLLSGSALNDDPLPRFEGFKAVEVLSQAIPPEIVHDVRRLRIDIGDDKHEGRLELQGMLGSIEERDAVAAALEAHECLQDLEKGRTTPAPGEDRINYQIEAVIRCPNTRGAEASKSRTRRRETK